MFDERKEAEMRLYSERLARELALKKRSDEDPENAGNTENAENSETTSVEN
ncbi:hypothetical protein [Streptomyces olindensis]|uniref:hypothetical protein n=1 Tax=Streptomyces olindensis TaxID=358823 RepID=UPI0033E81A82